MIIQYEEFEEKYKPIQNYYTSALGEKYYTFETYGEELEYVESKDNKNIWTLIEGEEENTYVIPGFHIVNRIGFFVTENGWENENIEVNMNEMLTIQQAINHAKMVLELLSIITDDFNISEKFTLLSLDNKMTVGTAKYTLIDLYTELTNEELTSKQEDFIHDYYSQI